MIITNKINIEMLLLKLYFILKYSYKIKIIYIIATPSTRLKCENRNKIRKTNPNPTAKLILYIAAKKINAIRIKFPKTVSNKLTKRFGMANITTHNTINNVIKPTTKLRFFLENTSKNDNVIYIIYF